MDLENLTDDEFKAALNTMGNEETPAEEELEDDIPDEEEDAEEQSETETDDDAEEEAGSDDDGEEEEAEPLLEKDNVSPTGSEGGEEEEEPSEKPNYEEFYNNVMKPFKANGKTIELKDPEDVMRLVKMGSNYTHKMQSIAPHRKILMALENNGLLDQEKINFLIDLNNKNPDAINQLIKQSEIDPLDIDVDSDKEYTPQSYAVSDQDVVLQEVIETLSSTPSGKDTLELIINSWDSESKSFAYSEPESLTLIHEQRENGIYDQIANEIDRRKVLGHIKNSTPFIEAYKTVGDELFGNKPVAKAPIERRAFKQKASVNSNKAKAASHSKATKGAKPLVDPSNMSDEDFKQFIEMNKKL